MENGESKVITANSSALVDAIYSYCQTIVNFPDLIPTDITKTEDDIKSQIECIILSLTANPGYYYHIWGMSTIYIFTPIVKDFPEKDITILKKNCEKLYDYLMNLNEDTPSYVACSCIIGAFLADAMGSYCEFQQGKSKDLCKMIWLDKNTVFPSAGKGQITDDSEMALCQCYAIMDSKNPEVLEQHALFLHYGIWSLSSPIDCGLTVRTALRIFDGLKDKSLKNELLYKNVETEVTKSTSTSKSNGFLMKLSPFAVWFYWNKKAEIKDYLQLKNFIGLYKSILAEVALDIQIIHGCPCLKNVGAIYIFAILTAFIEKSSTKVLENVIDLVNQLATSGNVSLEEKSVCKEILENYKIIKETHTWEDPENVQLFANIDTTHIGYYMHGVNLCLFYLKYLDQMKQEIDSDDIYRTIIYDICNLGGDTDTNGCIVGALIGPLIGLKLFGSEVEDLIKFVSVKRCLYTNAFGIEFVKFLYNKTPPKSETQYPFNTLRMILSMMSLENFEWE